MVATGAITQSELEYFRSEADCLGEENYREEEEGLVLQKVSMAVDAMREQDANKVGKLMADVAVIMCTANEVTIV